MLIGKRVLDEEKVVKLIAKIKNKKELNELSADFVRDQLFNYLLQEQKIVLALSSKFNPKSAVYKQVVKAVRSKLRRAYGLFRVSEESKKRRAELEKLYQSQPGVFREESLKKVLSTNFSTKERLPFYPQLYEQIFQITGKPKVILDLGCGINPFSVYWLTAILKHISKGEEDSASFHRQKLFYYGFDLSEEEVETINIFFKWWREEAKKEDFNFKGIAEVLDLFHFAKLFLLKKADIAFLWKMTDVLDRGQGHKVSEAVIKTIPSKYIIVSFPTLTMSGKKMNFPRRKWIELLCARLCYKYEILQFSTEIFYVIKK